MNNVNIGNGNQNQNNMESRYRYLEHMTDLVVEAYGNNIAECYENSAIATINAMFDISKVEPKNKVKIIAKGFDLKNLLYDWIEKILLLIYIDRIVINNFEYIHVKRTIKDNQDQILRNEIISVIPNDRNSGPDINKNSLFDLNTKKINETYEIEGIGTGEPPSISKHDYKIEIKSVTYHEMEMKFDQNRGFIFKFLLDL
ncbi:MAG: archease [Nitrososphaeraceae archaeon]